ncbi:hypothetical protein QJS10_CPA07g00713 [Acorus calamus]|uniref:SAM-dependent MTase RsmB/NOP-type domain-containing protein n=1 Tax=Acorus calamus TaxID=4465 RepID=A0AAV9EES8_ACOCL|nr:hypothetical protein QJS10_CPA07g00713 [Acorus calamus]
MKRGKGKQETEKSASMIDRREGSAYFARREAARVLRTVLRGDARRRAVGSIKSLVYSPSVRNKKGTFALVCQTLKHLPLLKDLLKKTDILKGKWKRQEELIFVVMYDILFGQVLPMHSADVLIMEVYQASVTIGASEKFVLHQKNALESALARLCAKKNVKHAEDLLLLNNTPNVSKPRYVRVNTLKLDVELALQQLKAAYKVKKDDMVPDLFVLPPGTDLHNHPLVMNGSLFLQGKASSMVAVALMPEPEWEVCYFLFLRKPKTISLCLLMYKRGQWVALDQHKKEIKLIKYRTKLSRLVLNFSKTNVIVVENCMFFFLNYEVKTFEAVRGRLLSPHCSSMGAVESPLPGLLPSTQTQLRGPFNSNRLLHWEKIQKETLAHALSFPAVERVVYSTCSIFKEENEDVIKSVLPLAHSLNFELGTPFPRWPRRGLPVFGGESVLLMVMARVQPIGFRISYFLRQGLSKGIIRSIIVGANAGGITLRVILETNLQQPFAHCLGANIVLRRATL